MKFDFYKNDEASLLPCELGPLLLEPDLPPKSPTNLKPPFREEDQALVGSPSEVLANSQRQPPVM